MATKTTTTADILRDSFAVRQYLGGHGDEKKALQSGKRIAKRLGYAVPIKDACDLQSILDRNDVIATIR